MKVLRALGGRPIELVVGVWMPASATPWREGIVLRFVLGGRHVADRFEQATRVEPIDPLERGEFDCLEMPPRSLPLDHFRLEEADDRFGEGVEAPICQECC